MIGYEDPKALKFYQLLLGKHLFDGLRVIVGDHDTIVMFQISAKVKKVYFDHKNQIGGVNWDDVVAKPSQPLPKVINPSKTKVIPKKAKEKLPVFYTNLKKGRVENNVPTNVLTHTNISDSEVQHLVDNGNEVEEGDLDFFEDVETPIQVKNDKKARGIRLKALVVDRTLGGSDGEDTNVEEDSDVERLDIAHSNSDGEYTNAF
jgi:hypothetical protein